jgi:hypothetical protein
MNGQDLDIWLRLSRRESVRSIAAIYGNEAYVLRMKSSMNRGLARDLEGVQFALGQMILQARRDSLTTPARIQTATPSAPRTS